MAHKRFRQRIEQTVKQPYDLYIRDDVYGGLYDHHPFVGDQTCFSKIERFADTVGNRRGWNPCSHTKLSLTGSGTPPENTLDQSTLVFPAWVSNGTPGLVYPSETQINDFAWAAFLNATTQVPETISVPNFLAELGDLKELIPKWIGSLTKWIANGFLAYEFGWKPLLDDLQKIATAAEDAKRRLEFLRKTYGKPTDIHFRKSLVVRSEDLGVPMDDVITDPSLDDYLSCATLVPYSDECSWTLTSTIRVYHELKGLNDALALAGTLAALTGWQNPLKVIWNGIPFSFVLEYFVKLGHLLDSLQLPPFEGEIRVLDSWWSQKCKAEQTVYYRRLKPLPPGLEDPTPYYAHTWVAKGKLRNEQYDRRHGTPLGAMVFATEGLSSTQLAILAALIYTNGSD